LAYNLHNLPANGKQGSIPEEISQILLTKTWTKFTPITLLSQRKLALTARNTLFALKIIEATTKFKKMALSPI
jgi:hypothetical protein